MTVVIVFVVVALILFILAGIGVGSPYNLEAFGLAFLTLAYLFNMGIFK